MRRAAAALLASPLLALGACGDGPAGRDRSTPAADGCDRPAAYAGSRLFTVQSGGTTRRYFLHLPPGARTGRRLALVLGLHGTGGKAGFFEQQSGLSRVADRAGFAALYPYALGSPSRWTLPGEDGPDDAAFIRAALRAAAGQACVDPRRVFAFGHSNGGGFAVALACTADVHLAGAASFSGGYGVQQRCAVEPPPPLLEAHGDADPVVPYAGARAFVGTWARWSGCRGRMDDPGPDHSTRTTFTGCASGARLVHLRRRSAGHDLPASAAPTAWAFLSSLRS